MMSTFSQLISLSLLCPEHNLALYFSPALRVVDRVLSHMNSPHYDMRLYTDLEKLVHAAHMQDVWQEAAMAYKKLTEVI